MLYKNKLNEVVDMEVVDDSNVLYSHDAIHYYHMDRTEFNNWFDLVEQPNHICSVSVKEFATYLLVYTRNKYSDAFTVTKMNRLMYCCYGAFIAREGYSLIQTPPVCWKSGPVFEDTIWIFKTGDINVNDYIRVKDSIPLHTLRFLHNVIDMFAVYDDEVLVTWCKLEGSPYKRVIKNHIRPNQTLDNNTIKTYFETFVDKTY